MLLLAVLVWSTAARAHFAERTDSLWGFVSRSDLVAVGTVLRSQHFEEKGHTTLPGAVRLRIDELLLGDAPGGEVGVLVEGLHQPRYADGERVLVFAERSGAVLRSIQSRAEKVTLGDGAEGLLATVRRYLAVAKEADPELRLLGLRKITLELLKSTVPRIYEDAVFDLSRKDLLDAALDEGDIRGLGRLALAEDSPLVVREGIAFKLGVLSRGRRSAAIEPLERLAREARSPVVRVAALNALRVSGLPAAGRIFVSALAAESRHVRLAAVDGLAAATTDAAVAALAGAADDTDSQVRFSAIRALVRISGPSAEAALGRIRSQGSPEQRRDLELAAAQRNPTDDRQPGRGVTK